MSFTGASEERAIKFWRSLGFACLGFILFLTAGFFWATSVPGNSYAGPISDPDDAQLPADRGHAPQ